MFQLKSYNFKLSKFRVALSSTRTTILNFLDLLFCSVFLCTFKGRVEFQRFDYTSCKDKSTSETAFNL